MFKVSEWRIKIKFQIRTNFKDLKFSLDFCKDNNYYILILGKKQILMLCHLKICSKSRFYVKVT